MQKRVLIFDGDSIAFRASAAIDNRSVLVKHLPSERTKVFKNRTEFKDLLVLKGTEFKPELYEFTDQQDAGSLITACRIMRNQTEGIVQKLDASEVLICLSGESNFRDSLPLPSKYKGQREGAMRPVHLKAAKAFLWKNYPSVLADNREADDDLIIKGYEYLDKGYDPVLASVDKDAFSATGLSLYDFTADNAEVEKVPDFGSLWDTGKKITGRGFVWLMAQMLMGDNADDWKPSEIAGKKYGEKTAYKLLKDCRTHAEALTKVIQQYKTWYPEPVTYTAWDGREYTKDYRDIFQMYFYCARMMQHENDKLDAAEFCSKYGVEL